MNADTSSSHTEEAPGEMDGDGSLFARQDDIAPAWGPPAANHFIATDGGWRNPERP
jgi:hypothetical protein